MLKLSQATTQNYKIDPPQRCYVEACDQDFRHYDASSSFGNFSIHDECHTFKYIGPVDPPTCAEEYFDEQMQNMFS